MPKSVALVALLPSAPAAGPSVTSVPASVASAATASVGLRALSGEVTYPVAPVADRPATLLSRVGTLASEVTGPRIRQSGDKTWDGSSKRALNVQLDKD